MSEFNETSVIAVTEKLAQATENIEKVFFAGESVGYKDGYDRAMSLGGYPGGYDAGKQAEYDAFWDAYQENGEKTFYTRAFERWPDACFDPKYDMKPTDCDRMFNRSSIVDIAATLEKNGVMLDTSKAPNLYAIFNLTTTKRVPPISAESSDSLELAFAWNKLETIDKLILKSDGTNTFKSTFSGADLLKNITVEGVIGNDIDFGSCTKLTRASIESIVNALSDTASGKTITFSESAVDDAFLFIWDVVDENGDPMFTVGSMSIVWRDLERTKPNWTITLV